MPWINNHSVGVTGLVSLRRAGSRGIERRRRHRHDRRGDDARAGRPRELPFLHDAIESIASPTIRNLATVGGNLFVPQPHGDLAVCLLALDAPARSSTRRPRTSASPTSSGLAVTSVSFADPGAVVLHQGDAAQARTGVDRHGRLRRRADRARRRRPRPGARASRPKRRSPAGSTDGRRSRGAAAVEDADPFDDAYASAWYRRRVLPVHVRRALLGEGAHHAVERRSSSTVNGEEREFLAQPGTTLLSALRDTLGLTAAKRGCAQGTCGTCTVPARRRRRDVLPGAGGDRSTAPTVKTLEGVTPSDGTLAPIQQAFLDGFATQCGFCTPGMIMAAEALLRAQPRSRRARTSSARSPATSAAARATRRSSTRDPRRRRPPMQDRHEHFADDATAFNVIGKRRPALGRARPRHRPHAVLRGHEVRRACCT